MSPSQSWSGPLASEVAGHEREDRAVVATGGPLSVVRVKRRLFRGLNFVRAHQPPHLLGMDHLAAVAQLGADAAVAVAFELAQGDISATGSPVGAREDQLADDLLHPGWCRTWRRSK